VVGWSILVKRGVGVEASDGVCVGVSIKVGVGVGTGAGIEVCARVEVRVGIGISIGLASGSGLASRSVRLGFTSSLIRRVVISRVLLFH